MPISNHWSFYSGTRLAFGRGCLVTLQTVMSRLGRPKVMLVTDPVLRELGLVERVLEPLRACGCQHIVFDQGEVEPSSDLALQAARLGREQQVQAVIGLGGGSNMDLAKLVAALLTNDVDPVDLFGFDTVATPTAPLVCIPTTAGTGSEVSHAAVIKHADTGRKGAILSQAIRPLIALVDPSLTDSCPRGVSAESGIDALTHAVEAYLATSYEEFDEDIDHGLAYEGAHPLGDMYAEQAIALIGRHLARAVQEPDDHQARDGMALAATLAGVAFSNCGVTLVHALEYWVGSQYPCSHGVGNGILLPEVMRYYLPVRGERLAKVASLLSETPEPVSDPESAIERVVALRRQIELPERLSQVGAEPEHLKKLARSAATLKRLLDLAPRPTTHQDLLAILQAAL